MTIPQGRKMPAEMREIAGRDLLGSLGIDISPEFAASLFAATKEKLVTGGWQAGKSVRDAAEVILDSPLWFASSRRWLYWAILPSYETPHKEFDYLLEWAARKGWLSGYSIRKGGPCTMSMLYGRIVVETRTGQNPEGIAGEPLDGILIVEAGQQQEAVHKAALGRTMTHDGWINQSGTLEDDEGHPRWSHYATTAEKWANNPPGSLARSFRLPSWANRTVYTLGEHDPKIEYLRDELDPFTFDRQVAAIPSGVQNPVYPQLQYRRDERLRPLPYTFCLGCHGSGSRNGRPCPTCNGAGHILAFTFVGGAGGIDYGDIHPAAVTAVSITNHKPYPHVWVRASRLIPGGDAQEIIDAKAQFTMQFLAGNWGVDPLQKWAAKLSGADTEAVSMGNGSRQGRFGLVRALLNGWRLYFDLDGEGVLSLYEEMLRVHYAKQANGELVPWRVADDQTASLEDAVEVLAMMGFPIPANPNTGTEAAKREIGASSIPGNRRAEELFLRKQKQDRRHAPSGPQRQQRRAIPGKKGTK